MSAPHRACRAGRALAAGLSAVLALSGGAARAEAPPAPVRVVSMNLCTDQLALLLAAPGQLVSVSSWAADPRASNLADEAAALPANHAGAEEVFLLRPDLVLAGDFTNPVSVALLRRLGLRVEVVPAATRLADVPVLLRQVGAALGREAQAEALVAAFEDRLARLRGRARALGREAGAYHYANNYTSGAGTLGSDVLDAAGLDNAAAALGLSGVTAIPLETLVMTRPFLVQTRAISGGSAGRAYETGAHPALRALRAEGRGATLEERHQVCGTPFVLEAVAALADARTAPPE